MGQKKKSCARDTKIMITKLLPTCGSDVAAPGGVLSGQSHPYRSKKVHGTPYNPPWAEFRPLVFGRLRRHFQKFSFLGFMCYGTSIIRFEGVLAQFRTPNFSFLQVQHQLTSYFGFSKIHRVTAEKKNAQDCQFFAISHFWLIFAFEEPQCKNQPKVRKVEKLPNLYIFFLGRHSMNFTDSEI